MEVQWDTLLKLQHAESEYIKGEMPPLFLFLIVHFPPIGLSFRGLVSAIY